MSAKLSVCLIVKNEADVLPRCLASIADVADEIIAVDTGSTDGSQEILRKAGAKVIEIPWPDDFAAARNAGLQHVTGDWVLILDADEALDEATRDQVKLLMVSIAEPISYLVPILNYLDDNEDGDTTISYMQRLFNHPGSHLFLGRIHELLFGSTPVRLDPAVLLIRHWGYMPSRRKAKNKPERDLALLKDNAENQSVGEGSDLAIYQAVATKDLDERLELAESVVADASGAWHASDALAVIIATSLILETLVALDRLDDAVSRADELLAQFPQLESEAQFWYMFSRLRLIKGDKEASFEALQRAYGQVAEHQALQFFWTESVPTQIATDLAMELVDRGDLDTAQTVIATALKAPRVGARHRARLQAVQVRILTGQGRNAEAEQLANDVLEVRPDLRFNVSNAFISNQQPLAAIQLAAASLDAANLRERVSTLALRYVGGDQGIAVIDWYMQAYGSDDDLQLQLGLHYLARHDEAQAREHVAAGLHVPVSDVRVELRLAHFEQLLDQPDLAEQRLASVTSACQETGNEDWLGETLVQWGNLAYQLQQWPKAIDLLEAATELRPNDAYVRFAFGSAHLGVGDTAAARTQFERALIIDPHFRDARAQLDRLDTAPTV